MVAQGICPAVRQELVLSNNQVIVKEVFRKGEKEWHSLPTQKYEVSKNQTIIFLMNSQATSYEVI